MHASLGANCNLGDREVLQAGSNQPRFDARLDTNGSYINPFTGQTGTKAAGTHIPLEKFIIRWNNVTDRYY